MLIPPNYRWGHSRDTWGFTLGLRFKRSRRGEGEGRKEEERNEKKRN